MANTIEIAKFQAPTPGDHVVCLHQNWAYYLATVESFDPNTLEYTVNWDDQDPTGRVQSYEVNTDSYYDFILTFTIIGLPVFYS